MIGKRIRFIRKKKGMTMKYLGIAAGLPENSADIRIAQYESGTRTPKADLLRKIADVLDVSPDPLAFPDLEADVVDCRKVPVLDLVINGKILYFQ